MKKLLLFFFILLFAGCAKEDPGDNPMKVVVISNGPVTVTKGESGEGDFTFKGLYRGDTKTDVKPFYTLTGYTINYNQTLPPFSGGISIYIEAGSETDSKVLVFPARYSEYIASYPFSTGANIRFTGQDSEGRPVEATGNFTITILENNGN